MIQKKYHKALWAVAVVLLFAAGYTVPMYDNRALYATFPVMSVDQITHAMTDTSYEDGPETFFAVRNKFMQLQNAATRGAEEARTAFEKSEFVRLNDNLESRRTHVGSQFDSRYGQHVMSELRTTHIKTAEEVSLMETDAILRHQALVKTGWFLLFVPVFLFFALWALFRSKHLSFLRELACRPWKLAAACVAPTWGFDSYGEMTRREQARQCMQSLATMLSSVFPFFVAFAPAKAQNNDSGKNGRQKVSYMLDYRRGDAVTGDGTGGLPNTVFATLSNLPLLPKCLSVQNLSSFGETGHQSDTLVGCDVKTPVKGLVITPFVGVQANTNQGANGVLYGTEGSLRRGRLTVTMPSLAWFERVWKPKPATTFWSVARPFFRLNGSWAVGGEVGVRTITDKPDFFYIGPAVQKKLTKRSRVELFGLWRSNGVWIFKSRFVFAGTF